MGLSKAELIERVNARSAGRYGEPIDEVWLNDRIKDGLIDRLERVGNYGTSPRYVAHARHYRRALQLKRLEAAGLTSRDAMLVQLFICKYSVSPAVVNTAISRELLRALQSLKLPLRSNYFWKDRNVGPKSEAILSGQMGPLDDRFLSMKLPIETYLDFARQFFQYSTEGQAGPFVGIIADANSLGKLVINASPEKIGFARDVLCMINDILFRPYCGNAVLATPEYAAFLMAMLIKLGDEQSNARAMIDWLTSSEAFAEIARKIMEPVDRHEPEGFS